MVCTEVAMSLLIRVWFKFNARSLKAATLLLSRHWWLSFNCIDENKRGVANEQSTWEARRQEASAATTVSLSFVSVSETSSLRMIPRISLGR